MVTTARLGAATSITSRNGFSLPTNKNDNLTALDANQWLGAVKNSGGNLFVLVASITTDFVIGRRGTRRTRPLQATFRITPVSRK